MTRVQKAAARSCPELSRLAPTARPPARPPAADREPDKPLWMEGMYDHIPKRNYSGYLPRRASEARSEQYWDRLERKPQAVVKVVRDG